MKTYWVENPQNLSIAVAGKPAGNEWLRKELLGLKTEGVDLVVSTLEHEENDRHGLSDERRACEEAGLDFLSFSIPDRGVPESMIATMQFAASLYERAPKGNAIVVHCIQGLGRSPLLAACVFVMAGVEVESALSSISSARNLQVPETPEQRDFLARFAAFKQNRSVFQF